MIQNEFSLREKNKINVKERILESAEILLTENNNVDFSMRELAKKANVSFATPFNYFGDKNSILQELSSQLIKKMENCFNEKEKNESSIKNLFLMAHISIEVLLEKPILNKYIITSLSIPRKEKLKVKTNSENLWKIALGNMSEFTEFDKLKEKLVTQIALHFRGVISFWCAGDIEDKDLKDNFIKGICFLCLGISKNKDRDELLKLISENSQNSL